MCGWVGKKAEIVGRSNNPFAEVMLPESIDEDARREGIVPIGHPLGELQPSLGRPGGFPGRVEFSSELGKK